MSTATATDSLRADPELAVTIGYGTMAARDYLKLMDPAQAPSKCTLRIYRPTTNLILVVFSDTPENHGASVTNAIDRLACAILNEHYVAREEWHKVLFLQHYPPAWYSQIPIKSRPASTRNWTEEIHLCVPAIRWATETSHWDTAQVPPTQWKLVAHMEDCTLRPNDNLKLGIDNPAMLAVASWLLCRETDLLTPDIEGLRMRWGLKMIMWAQGAIS
ncbi:MAG: hypothetical protein U0X20_17210 [Caldilineaceae bacterium]